MKTVVLGPRPAELEQLIERRHALGIDTYDEEWEGEYHRLAPPGWWASARSTSAGRAVMLWDRQPDGNYSQSTGAGLLGMTAADLAAAIDWPDPSD